jgi:hypothetical protein
MMNPKPLASSCLCFLSLHCLKSFCNHIPILPDELTGIERGYKASVSSGETGHHPHPASVVIDKATISLPQYNLSNDDVHYLIGWLAYRCKSYPLCLIVAVVPSAAPLPSKCWIDGAIALALRNERYGHISRSSRGRRRDGWYHTKTTGLPSMHAAYRPLHAQRKALWVSLTDVDEYSHVNPTNAYCG